MSSILPESARQKQNDKKMLANKQTKEQICIPAWHRIILVYKQCI